MVGLCVAIRGFTDDGFWARLSFERKGEDEQELLGYRADIQPAGRVANQGERAADGKEGMAEGKNLGAGRHFRGGNRHHLVGAGMVRQSGKIYGL